MLSLKELREPARLFGGLALKGGKTEKMRYAAEYKRFAVLNTVSDIDAAIGLCDQKGLAASCEFWLKNKDKTPSEFEVFILKQKALLAEYKSGNKSVALLYNELTKIWGFD